MCVGCYESYGSPKIMTDATTKVADLIKRVYERELSGGNLHIVVDDWNLENDSIEFCLEEITKQKENYDDPQLDLEWMTGIALLCLSLEERASALGLVDGFI